LKTIASPLRNARPCSVCTRKSSLIVDVVQEAEFRPTKVLPQEQSLVGVAASEFPLAVKNTAYSLRALQ
jgi:hypothetical protein